MEGTNIVKSTFGKTSSFFLKLAAISTAALAVVNVYSFYRNNLWRPKIVINKVDYVNGVANLTINGKKFVLRGDSTFLIDYDWGIKFGYTFLPDGKRIYDRIEVTKRGMTHEVVRQNEIASVLSFTGNQETFWNKTFDN